MRIARLAAGAAAVAALTLGTATANASVHHHHPGFAGFAGIAVAQINRVDSGNGGDWANDQINRITIVTQTGPNTYHVTINDEGSFHVIPGANVPNQGDGHAGVKLTAIGNGSLGGSASYNVTSAHAPNMAALSGHITGAPTSTWPDLAFGPGTSHINNDWGWTYSLTCPGFNGVHPPTQGWADTAANGDGNLPGDGNIFGC